MLLAQIFLFVALQLFDGDTTTKDAITLFLVGSFALWLVLNIVFFCSIDISYVRQETGNGGRGGQGVAISLQTAGYFV